MGRQLNCRPTRDGFILTPDSINRLVEQLLGAQELYRQVGGVHTSVLSDGERVIVSAEDIGRHNSLDKIAGICLLDRIELSRKNLLTTGRLSSEMMQKAAHIGASAVISRTSPSALSIKIAQAWGVTLVGYARRDQFNVYTHPERILQTTGEVCLVSLSKEVCRHDR
jgi:FdhD protein